LTPRRFLYTAADLERSGVRFQELDLRPVVITARKSTRI